jgi:hypothetical protein
MDRVLNVLAENLQPARDLCTVSHSVVCGQRDLQPFAGNDLPVHYNRFVPNAPHRQDGGFRRVDDCDEMIHLEHAQV